MNFSAIRLSIAKLQLSGTIQLILAKDDNWFVRCNLSSNRYLSEISQLALTKDIRRGVLVGLASNSIISEKVQLILANHDNIYAKIVLCCNDNLTRNARLFLSKNGDESVKKKLADYYFVEKVKIWFGF